MKIRLIGQRNATGIGNHFANFADALKQIRNIKDLVEEVDYQNQQEIDRSVGASQADDINISFVAANVHDFFKGHNVQWIVFETTHIFDHLRPALTPADNIWVPSKWGRQILIDNGFSADKILVMPEGVESSIYHPYARIETGRPFRFLMLGKYERRKSFHETIQAFAQVFANQPDVELFIKSHTFGDADLATRDLLGTLDGLGLQNVGVYWGEMNRNQLAELYRDSDVFVFPSKGEGWGLPLIEAAASGLPIITTMYSGQTEFLEPIKSSVIPVDYVLVPVDCPDYQRDYPGSDNNYGAWARPDPYSIADAMKTAKNNYKKLSKNALKNSQIIRKNYSWAQCAEKALAAMESNGWL